MNELKFLAIVINEKSKKSSSELLIMKKKQNFFALKFTESFMSEQSNVKEIKLIICTWNSLKSSQQWKKNLIRFISYLTIF